MVSANIDELLFVVSKGKHCEFSGLLLQRMYPELINIDFSVCNTIFL